MPRLKRPLLVFADSNGRILEHPNLEMIASSGGVWTRVSERDLITLPEGSELFFLEERFPVGYDPLKKRFVVVTENPYNPGEPVRAVSAFIAPAHTATYLAAYKSKKGAPILPLFSYAAVGWHRGNFVVTAIRVDPDERQDVKHFDAEKIRSMAKLFLTKYRHNRLIQHLGNCALGYACPAAKNFFLQRWEAPLPTSPVCNARCLGCISLQENPQIPSTQQRITFVPSPEEIAEVACLHFKKAPRPVVSFGQGCEGEPLLQAKTIERAIKLIREETSEGTININTNGSRPEAVYDLSKAGLNSVRVSVNSFQPHYYHAYYRPKGYTFDDVKRFIEVAKKEGLFVSLNYFILPGFTDSYEERKALESFLKKCPVDLIQMRNFNIDYEWYFKQVGFKPSKKGLGIIKWMEIVKEVCPDINFGYFNPYLGDRTFSANQRVGS